MNKTIHYIWLGGKKKPRVIRKCIASWKKHMPDWEIKEWNESNLDLDRYAFCREAYDAKRYAYAADVLRFDILYREGGLYFDTDVKVLKSLTPLTEKYRAIAGYEFEMVAPGLVLYAAEPNNLILKEVLDDYETSRFIVDGKENHKVVGVFFTEVLKRHGYVCENTEQCVEGFTILPSTYFCPTDGYRNPINFSENTYSEHLFAGSWMPLKTRLKNGTKRFFYKLLGRERIQRWLHKK